jgi:hypothetical protein
MTRRATELAAVRNSVTGLIGMWDGMRAVYTLSDSDWADWRATLGGLLEELASHLDALDALDEAPVPGRRKLSPEERIQARHLLQVLSEQARDVRNAVEPYTGVLSITDEAWCAQWAALTRALDNFTEGVRAGRPPSPYTLGDRNA